MDSMLGERVAHTPSDAELLAVARRALRTLAGAPDLAHKPLRARVLRAVETLEAVRQEIVVRCDLHGELHKNAISELGLSRRQFYRERREALIALGRWLSQREPIIDVSLSLRDVREALLDRLRSAGAYDLVARDASQLAGDARGDGLFEIRLWGVASEASRYLGRMQDAIELLDRAEGAQLEADDEADRLAQRLWVAAGRIAIAAREAEFDDARKVFADAEAFIGDERMLHGRGAILFSILLSLASAVEIDCGDWNAASDLLRRSRHLASRSDVEVSRPSLLRQAGLLALRGHGDPDRAIESLRESLETSVRLGQFGTRAHAAVQLGIALERIDPRAAQAHLEFGLELAQRFYPGDGFAKMVVEALPTSLRLEGGARANERLRAAQATPNLGRRDALLIDFAQARLDLMQGHAFGRERVRWASDNLARRGMRGWPGQQSERPERGVPHLFGTFGA
jgi:tetratricopeptide (TPR) repeat protein